MSSLSDRKTIAIAGAGDMARYLVEELAATGLYNIAVLSRADRPWFSGHPSVTLHLTDYTHASLLSILNATQATTLFSLLHSNSASFFLSAQTAMLSAVRASTHCTRLVPSEYGGNLATHPHLPRFYIPTHVAFREVLRSPAADGVEWTLVNGGWFMDYVVPTERTWLKPLPGVWPVDVTAWEATVLGSGEEKVGWTAGRDVARALVALVGVPQGGWEQETYVCGELGNWNDAIRKIEGFYGPRLGKGEMKKTRRTREEIEGALEKHKDDQDPALLWGAYMDEWNITGASAVPWEMVVRQREKYFPGIKFRGIMELMEDAERMDKV